MRFISSCAQCDNENGRSRLFWLQYNDSGRYDHVCHKGHSAVTITQLNRFEMLFEIGAYAITDGYYREAISSFTASLERFYEYFIRVICKSKNIEWDLIQETWKEVSAQSERQLGSFVFLYLLEFGEKPNLLSKKNIELRNKVVHKGKIPTREDAVDFGQEVLDLVRPVISKLRERYHVSAMPDVTFQEMRSTFKPTDSYVGSGLRQTILSTVNIMPGHLTMSLEEALVNMQKWLEEMNREYQIMSTPGG